MSQFTNIMKNGWHPEKQGTTIKNQMKGLVGRGDKDYNRNPDHVSRPLHSLADPSTLPPPPQRRDTTASSSPNVVAPDSRFSRHNQISSGEEPSPSPRPYRSDATGLRTDHLPPPPGRRDGADADGLSPPLYTAAMKSTGGASSRPPPPAVPRRASAGAGAGAGAPPPPSLPPRLPPRSAASPQTTGITSVEHEKQAGSGQHVTELQNRFARFHTSTSTPAAPTAQAPAQAPAQGGTTWAQKQAALKTASQLEKDPSSVSLSDAKSAASMANNFRQRHGEQIATGAATASRWNQKYGVTDKVGGFAQKLQGRQPESESGPEPRRGQGQGQGQEAAATGNSTLQGISGAISSGFTSAKKKPPPPPPPPSRKPGLGGGRVQQDGQDGAPPPPIPMSTRPNF